MKDSPKLTAFQQAEVGNTVIVKRYGNKTSKGTVTKKLPGALVVSIGSNIVVIDADKIVKTIK